MAAKSQAREARNYENFEPKVEFAEDQEHYIILLLLPGFTKEKLKVQLTSAGALGVGGERPLDGGNRWSRFHKQFKIRDDCDASRISARFENGVLFIVQPKKLPRTPGPAPETVPTAARDSVLPPPPSPTSQKGDGAAPTPPPPPTPSSSALRERFAAEDREKSSANGKAKITEDAAGKKSRYPPAAKEPSEGETKKSTDESAEAAMATAVATAAVAAAASEAKETVEKGAVEKGEGERWRAEAAAAVRENNTGVGRRAEQGNLGECMKLVMAVLLAVLVAHFVKKSYIGFFHQPENQ